MNQLSMIDPELGVILRDKGIARSINNAEDLEEDWSVKALSFLYEYAKTHDRFLCEDVRVASKGHLVEVNGRSWGGIVRRARDLGWIRSIGFRLVGNPNAHRTPATEWESLIG